MTSKHAKAKSHGAGWSLAAVAVLMVFAAVAAVFIPASGTAKPQFLYRSPLGGLLHPVSASPSDPVSPDPSPSISLPPAAPTDPVAQPVPITPYQSPLITTRTYPTPSPAVTCHPQTVRGTCYEPGQYCRNSQHGTVGLAGNGQPITCAFSNGWRWVVGSVPWPSPKPTSPSPSPTPTDLPPVKPLIQPMLGVVSDDPATWATTTHSNPVLATRYVSMATPLDPTWLHSAMRVANGATPVIELVLSANQGAPGISLTDVANGKADNWLTDLRAEIDQLQRPVIIAFAPEANGRWYSWGSTPCGSLTCSTNATAFKTAYIHVHSVLGTSLVTWMWQMSAHNPGDPATADFNAYWPGTSFVNWVGFDGYYYQPGDTFSLRFSKSLAEVESWWHGPVIIGETAVSPGTKNMPNDIKDLFNGVLADHLLGLIYLDLNVCQGQCTLYKQDFRVEDNAAALAAFIQEASSW